MNGLNQRALLISAGIAGVVMALLSNIPLINCVNCLLCGWIWAGGILAVFIYRNQEHNPPLDVTKGIIIGALAGVVAAVIGAIFALIFRGLNAAFVTALASLNPDVQSFGGGLGNLIASTSFGILDLIRNIIVYGIFGAIGGVIATALIWKSPATPPPAYMPPTPPPPPAGPGM